MLRTRILTTSEASSKHFLGSSGQAYTVFSEALPLSDGKIVSGAKQFMIKTSELDEFVEIVLATREAWKDAKRVEKETNEALLINSAKDEAGKL